MFALAILHYRRKNLYPRPLRLAHEIFHHLVNGLRTNGIAALIAILLADPRIENAKIVIYLGDGANRGTRVFAARFLLNRDCRGKTFDIIKLGLFHLTQKLTSIG